MRARCARRSSPGGSSRAAGSDGGFTVDAEPEAVGRAAAAAGVALAELRRADGGGLEELFMTLTAAPGEEAAA
jgi:ABC-2 type transport system ATP-binding protein